jgi:hypothetical protein
LVGETALPPLPLNATQEVLQTWEDFFQSTLRSGESWTWDLEGHNVKTLTS